MSGSGDSGARVGGARVNGAGATGSRGSGAAVRAAARITAAPDGRGGTALPVLDGHGPLALRRVRAPGSAAGVCVIGAMSAPLGGDRIRLDVAVEPGAALRVTAAAATVALPGRAAGPATYDVDVWVGEGAELHWLLEPLISAAGSELLLTTRVRLAPTARLVLREEQVLGRSGERPGRLVTRLTARHGDRLLLDQETTYGPGAPGWDTPAVLDTHRAVGQLLVVDPAFEEDVPEVRCLGGGPADGEGVVTPLPGPAVLATALAPDALRLRRMLDSALPGPG
ncbi:urease accessory protein UreD [Streptomyces sp. NPDC001922]|uniref:urease accessory protein UreD n=1 Tax=Streptomyces sp. NPDC001922 TaxID=3364624 RepID=UPI0036B8D6F8